MSTTTRRPRPILTLSATRQSDPVVRNLVAPADEGPNKRHVGDADHRPTRPPALQHGPADAETPARNRAKERERHAARARVEAALRELAPAAFNDEPPPLSIGISKDLVDLLAGEFKRATISRFMASWTRRPDYLRALARGDVRRNLDGQLTEPPSQRDREFAAKLLDRVKGRP